MKKTLVVLAATSLFFACQSNKETTEEKKIDSVVNTTIKTEKEKSDSVFEYYQKKIDSAGDAVPEMPE